MRAAVNEAGKLAAHAAIGLQAAFTVKGDQGKGRGIAGFGALAERRHGQIEQAKRLAGRVFARRFGRQKVDGVEQRDAHVQQQNDRRSHRHRLLAHALPGRAEMQGAPRRPGVGRG